MITHGGVKNLRVRKCTDATQMEELYMVCTCTKGLLIYHASLIQLQWRLKAEKRGKIFQSSQNRSTEDAHCTDCPATWWNSILIQSNVNANTVVLSGEKFTAQSWLLRISHKWIWLYMWMFFLGVHWILLSTWDLGLVQIRVVSN